MVTILKGQTGENNSRGEQARPAADARGMATGVFAPQVARQESGPMGRLVSLLSVLNDVVAGPAMTEQERSRREVDECNAERERRLSMYL